MLEGLVLWWVERKTKQSSLEAVIARRECWKDETVTVELLMMKRRQACMQAMYFAAVLASSSRQRRRMHSASLPRRTSTFWSPHAGRKAFGSDTQSDWA